MSCIGSILKMLVHQLCQRIHDRPISAAHGNRLVNYKLERTICPKNVDWAETMRFTIIFLGVLGRNPVLGQIVRFEISYVGCAAFIALTGSSRTGNFKRTSWRMTRFSTPDAFSHPNLRKFPHRSCLKLAPRNHPGLKAREANYIRRMHS